jgi:hypothetical protein
VETADEHPITFASGERYTLATPVNWFNTSGTQRSRDHTRLVRAGLRLDRP